MVEVGLLQLRMVEVMEAVEEVPLRLLREAWVVEEE